MDAKTASQLINDAFMKIENSISLPGYDFDSISIIDMLTQGINLDNIKDYLNAFNICIKEKISMSRKGTSPKVLKRLEEACNIKIEI